MRRLLGLVRRVVGARVTRTRNPGYDRAQDTRCGRTSPRRSGSRGLTFRDATIEAHPVFDLQFYGATLTDYDDGTALLTIDAPAASGGVSAGTSNPGSPSAGDQFFRTDLGLYVWYSGSAWLTTQLFREPLAHQGNLNGNTGPNINMGRFAPWAAEFDLYITKLYTTTYVATTNNGSNYWTITFEKATDVDAKTSLGSFTTAADTVNQWTHRATSIAATYVAVNYREIDLIAGVGAGAPGALYWAASFTYRLIVP